MVSCELRRLAFTLQRKAAGGWALSVDDVRTLAGRLYQAADAVATLEKGGDEPPAGGVAVIPKLGRVA